MTTDNNYIIKIHNTETDEIIEREMTKTEIAELKANQKRVAELQAEADAKQAARQAIADRLGLTADELQVLLG